MGCRQPVPSSPGSGAWDATVCVTAGTEAPGSACAFTGAVRDIPWVGRDLGDERRQCSLAGTPVADLDELYEKAKSAVPSYEKLIFGLAEKMKGAKPDIAPLKSKSRAKIREACALLPGAADSNNSLVIARRSSSGAARASSRAR